MEIIAFTTNLEHVGDIIDKNLIELAAKKIKNRLRFSEEGFAEIETHARAACWTTCKLALDVFIAGDSRMARQLLEEKVRFRERERAASDKPSRSACAAAGSRASRPARCISTSCAT